MCLSKTSPDRLSKSELYESLLETLTASWQALLDKQEESPEGTLQALWQCAAGKPRAIEFSIGADLQDLNEEQCGCLLDLVDKRIAGVPLAYLTSRQAFMGIEMIAGPQALIPRKETEILGYAALEELKKLAIERQIPLVLDVCTGSGNIALALAYYLPDCIVYASDICPNAIDLAVRNAQFLGFCDRVEFRTGDLLGPFYNEQFVGKVDMITCNPPYIASSKIKNLPTEVIEHEPELAFAGGPLGVSIILRLISGAPHILKPNSWLCFEVGVGQWEFIKSRVERNCSYNEIKTYLDPQGNVRAILARTI